ncbi:hypothetical protein C8N43_2946 [Litoreibacter ponti]|uniref:Excalibur calcium-binding domain-containing protein n=1 Tax=Litoreibacter ponti TaxID=1510457 RepID=A0A2T6BDJ7_9RHOB|nr:hypothetical protein [Litoreibacter ponti]PTX54139.1 hypothetical protein C8N43_2946 [Litoreibacter ponti]
MRGVFAVFSVAVIAACTTPVPDSAKGVGFENYDSYLAERQAREAELRRGTTAAGTAPATVAPPTGTAPTEAEQTASAAVAAVRGTDGRPARGESVPAGIQNTSPNAALQPDLDNPSISDEQDFQAVSSRQSIESDAARRQAQSAQYKVIEPTAVPRRPGAKTPTPIEFALETRHPVGQKVYRRSPFGAGKAAQACASYGSSELAQDAFLKAGGPSKDKLGVDPDGDGYACGWNPAKYRSLVRN